jgi:adenylate kinase family enzyme
MLMACFSDLSLKLPPVVETRKTMAKIHILGGSGSGKTTLARDLSSLLHLPHYDLDEIGLKNGLVTEDDAFAIAGQPGWISEGCYLIWTEPLLSQADCIVLLEVSWPVAAWRIIRRHITRSLHGTNPYRGVHGVKLLFKLVKDTRRTALNKVRSDTAIAECMRKYLEERRGCADPPTPESVGRDVEKYLMISVPPTAEFVRRYLEKYQEKVFLVRNNADRERLLELFTRHR